jgi:dienelactone hydrolase
VSISAGTATLEGELIVPPAAAGLVIFAHGSGSSRHSPRNQAVAATLRERGLGTLLMDLLTRTEEAEERVTRHHRFDIALLSARLAATVQFAAEDQRTATHRIGLFGASTGAAAALVAAAESEGRVGAVVSRGGRPDLAGSSLAVVTAPTLLIVGAADAHVLELNREALAQMKSAVVHLEIVPRAGHLFSEHGTLDQVADLAADWFGLHLAA